MRRLLTRRAAAILVVAVAVFGIGATVAYAYWSSTGQGTGSTAGGGLQPVTVTALSGGDSPNTVLLPGGSADVIVRIDNPNSFAVTLVSVSGNGAITADGGHPSCTVTGVSFVNQSGLTANVAASGTTLVHLAGAASMDATSSNGCQDATFTIPVSITVHS